MLDGRLAPTNFFGPSRTNPHDVGFALWTAAGDDDVTGGADNVALQTFHVFERGSGFRFSAVLQGAGHADFHDGCFLFEKECPVGDG